MTNLCSNQTTPSTVVLTYLLGFLSSFWLSNLHSAEQNFLVLASKLRRSSSLPHRIHLKGSKLAALRALPLHSYPQYLRFLCLVVLTNTTPHHAHLNESPVLTSVNSLIHNI